MQNSAQSILSNRVDLVAPHEDPSWIEEPYAARKAVTLFAGREGEGKSMVMQDAAIRYASNGHKVLVLDVENGPRLIAERLQKLGMPPELSKKIAVYAPSSFDLTNVSEDFMAFQAMAEVEEPDVIIMDSLRSLYGGSLSGSKIGGMMELLKLCAQTWNCCIILLHHTTKAGNTYLGSGAIGGTVEMVYFLLRHKDDPDPQRRVISCYKNRLTQEPKDSWLRIISEANSNVLEIAEAEPFIAPQTGSRDLLTSRIMLILFTHQQDNPKDDYLSMTEIINRVNRPGKESTVKRIVNALVDTGHISPKPNPNSKSSRPSYVYKAAPVEPDAVEAAINTDGTPLTAGQLDMVTNLK